MGRLCCSTDGNLNEEKFSEPASPCHRLVYAAAASLTCAVVMACDALHGFGKHKLWYPCKYFSLNATSPTIIAVAIKYSLDLNTVMPHKQDRLTKLSSAVFMCTVMGNTMPSLGAIETKELLMNIIALGILVSTMIVNICFQLGTGIIFVFWKEHAFIMLIMLVLLVIYFSALTVPINTQYLLLKHNKK